MDKEVGLSRSQYWNKVLDFVVDGKKGLVENLNYNLKKRQIDTIRQRLNISIYQTVLIMFITEKIWFKEIWFFVDNAKWWAEIARISSIYINENSLTEDEELSYILRLLVDLLAYCHKQFEISIGDNLANLKEMFEYYSNVWDSNKYRIKDAMSNSMVNMITKSCIKTEDISEWVYLYRFLTFEIGSIDNELRWWITLMMTQDNTDYSMLSIGSFEDMIIYKIKKLAEEIESEYGDMVDMRDMVIKESQQWSLMELLGYTRFVKSFLETDKKWEWVVVNMSNYKKE